MPTTSDASMEPERFAEFVAKGKAFVSETLLDDQLATTSLPGRSRLIAINRHTASHDEIARAETDGCIDLPPRDTCVWMSGPLLLAWVQDRMTTRMDQAIVCESHGAYSSVHPAENTRLALIGGRQPWSDSARDNIHQ